MKARLFLALIASLAFSAACSFDRSPLLREQASQMPAVIRADAASSGEPGTDASKTDVSLDVGKAGATAPASDAGMDAARDLGDAAGSEPNMDAAQSSDAEPHGDAAAPAIDAGPSGDPTHPTEPLMPPSMGGLECARTQCPFAPLPAKQCCTTAADVTQHTARAAERCGLDLDALDSATYGNGCWQRDQLGIVDDRCPSVRPGSGLPPEPGCCADDGQCGSLNAEQKLGCRHAPGGELRACQQPVQNISCEPTGTYGVRYTVDAAWGGRSGGLVGLTDDGRGKIQVYVAIVVEKIDAATHELKAKGHVCGVTLPPFYSTTLCEAYAPQFPNTLWESKTLPGMKPSGRYECTGAGCVISLNPSTYLLGFEMTNPEAPWPSSSQTGDLQCPSGRGQKCFPDHDDDGRPGVQLQLLTSGMAPGRANTCLMGYEYRGAPVSASVAAIFDGVRRTDRLLLGTRMKVAGSLRLDDDCSKARGSAIAEYVNSRASGCLIEQGTYNFPLGARAGANEPCESGESEFMDANLPVYELLTAGATPDTNLELSDRSESRGPEVTAVRLGSTTDAVSCNAVRSATY